MAGVKLLLEGKAALITGGSRGIGAETVRLFRAAGARVAFSYRQAWERAAELEEECGGQLWEAGSEGQGDQGTQKTMTKGARDQGTERQKPVGSDEGGPRDIYQWIKPGASFLDGDGTVESQAHLHSALEEAMRGFRIEHDEEGSGSPLPGSPAKAIANAANAWGPRGWVSRGRGGRLAAGARGRSNGDSSSFVAGSDEMLRGRDGGLNAGPDQQDESEVAQDPESESLEQAQEGLSESCESPEGESSEANVSETSTAAISQAQDTNSIPGAEGRPSGPVLRGAKLGEDDDEELVACVGIEQELETPADGRLLVEKAVAALGRLDILVVNHGIWPPEDAPIESMTDAQWRRTLGVNLDAVFGLMQAAVGQFERQGPGLRDQGSAAGHIVLISSTAGQRGEAFHADYAASKGALISLTKSMSSELAPRGILVNCVAPGWVQTEMSAGTLGDPDKGARVREGIPVGRAATPREIAGPVLFLCTPLAGFISGEVLNVNGGAVLVG